MYTIHHDGIIAEVTFAVNTLIDENYFIVP